MGPRPGWNDASPWTEEGDRVPSTLSLAVNTAIITMCASRQAVTEWALKQTAAVLIILFDPEVLRALQDPETDSEAAVAAQELYQGVENAITWNNSEEPYWHSMDLNAPGGVTVGKVLSRANTIADAAVAEEECGDTRMYFIL